mgnify:CR=1 FL=1
MLQTIINKFISLDHSSATKNILLALQHKNITIICTDFATRPLYCTFDQQKILFASIPSAQNDTIISSTLSGFVQFMLTKQNVNISITGDAIVAELLQKLYFHLDIDWEEQLSHITGDIVAHQAVKLIKQYKQQQSFVTNSLGEMLTEYLQEEIAILPTNCEINNFLQEVDDLRLAIDRLEARFRAYENS